MVEAEVVVVVNVDVVRVAEVEVTVVVESVYVVVVVVNVVDVVINSSIALITPQPPPESRMLLRPPIASYTPRTATNEGGDKKEWFNYWIWIMEARAHS